MIRRKTERKREGVQKGSRGLMLEMRCGRKREV